MSDIEQRQSFMRAEVEALWDTVERCVNTAMGAALVGDRKVIVENAVAITKAFEILLDGESNR